MREIENIYQQHGYKNRMEYLMSLADEYEIPFGIVCAAAQMLGKEEDFDGLIEACRDAEIMIESGEL